MRTTAKHGRLFIYGSLALIIITYNFFYELQFNSLKEAVVETIVLYPLIFFFLLLVFWTRKKIINSKLLESKSSYKKLRNIYIIIIIGLKAFVIAVISRIISIMTFEDDVTETFFDLLFFTVLLTVVVIIIFIYFFEDYLGFIQERHQLALELSNAEQEKMLSRYHVLKKQLNPHFLFNSFNSLVALIPLNPNKAERFVEELSNIYRYNLSQSDNVVVKLSEELEMIHSYLHLQQIRFGSALIYEEQSEIDTMEVLIPPMTLQLLIENAIKHNIVSKVKPLKIEVTINEEYLEVKNNFQPRDSQFQRAESFGIGLNSVINQLELITRRKLIISNNNSDYIVRVPLIKSELND